MICDDWREVGKMLNRVTDILQNGRLGYVKKVDYFTMLEKKVERRRSGN